MLISNLSNSINNNDLCAEISIVVFRLAMRIRRRNLIENKSVFRATGARRAGLRPVPSATSPHRARSLMSRPVTQATPSRLYAAFSSIKLPLSSTSKITSLTPQSVIATPDLTVSLILSSVSLFVIDDLSLRSSTSSLLRDDCMKVPAKSNISDNKIVK